MPASEREAGAFLRGEALYGDDFGPEEIAAWYADEKEAYSGLGAKDSASYRYSYHALNAFHGYRHLPSTTFRHAMGFGAAYGDELLPLAARIGAITIVEPSALFAGGRPGGVKAAFVQPRAAGTLPFESDTFDLITCLGVLHHIPNVSFVVRELARVLEPGGWLLMREPICSLGDWRKPRRGLTRRERGIPLWILRQIIRSVGLAPCRMTYCNFPLIPRLFGVLCPEVYNSPLATRVDSILSTMFSWNVNYHPQRLLQRLRPISVFLVLRKPQAHPDPGPRTPGQSQPVSRARSPT